VHEIDRIIAAARAVIGQGKRGILVTIVGTRGSTYRRPGARAVISEDGESFGTISGGCLERDLGERAKMWLGDFEPRVITYDATRQDDVIFGLGLGCRGETDLLIEPFDAAHPPQLLQFKWNGREPVTWTSGPLTEVIRPPRAIAIFGAGRDVEPVARLAEAVGWNATIIGARQPFDADAFDAAIVMTHNFMQDLELLEALLPSAIPYVGLLGPKTRADDLLARAGLDGERLHAPIGLDLGAETPDEIALSIIAEVQAFFGGRSAQPLSAGEGPIHVRSRSELPASDCGRRDSDRTPTPARRSDRR
jgi:xanthine dehydrogenase accessory factor